MLAINAYCCLYGTGGTLQPFIGKMSDTISDFIVRSITFAFEFVAPNKTAFSFSHLTVQNLEDSSSTC